MPLSPALIGRNVVRWGILGCGDVTEVKSGPGFRKALGSELVAVMRRNGKLAADYAKRHGVRRWYDDARKLVEDPEVDAIYIATPPGAHLDSALLVAAAGKPCYMEKPMARHTPECDAMIQAFAQANQKLFVAYYRRAMPRFLKVRELLDGDAIGRLSGISYRMFSGTRPSPDPAVGGWRVDAANAGGGLLLDIGSHVLDFIDFCVGPLGDVQGSAARNASTGNVENSVTITFRTKDDVLGTGIWNFASHVEEDVLEFTGPKGRIVFNFFAGDPVRLITAKGEEQFDLPNPAHVAQPLIQTVVDDLLGRGTCPSTAESARRTQKVMDQALAGYYGGRDDAFWNRPKTWPGCQA
jgi:1,5-anhydro-D-fructose reductase (1,5-anhydro-D-mannitol-forming)